MDKGKVERKEVGDGCGTLGAAGIGGDDDGVGGLGGKQVERDVVFEETTGIEIVNCEGGLGYGLGRGEGQRVTDPGCRRNLGRWTRASHR